MNAMFSPRSLRWLLLSLLALGCLPLFVVPAFAGTSSEPMLQANFIFELVADRARMIQVSVVCVAFGCAIIWWYK